MKKVFIEEYKENGKRFVKIDLKDDDYAVMTAQDWSFLRDLGIGRLRKGPNNHVIASCKAASNGYVLVSRVLLGATEHESVIFRDKNPHNLRRSNLVLRYDPRRNLTNSRELVVLSSNASSLEAVSGHS